MAAKKKTAAKKAVKKATKPSGKPIKKANQDAKKPSGIAKKPVQRKKKKKFYFEPFPLLNLDEDLRAEVLRHLLVQKEPLLSIPLGKDKISRANEHDLQRAHIYRYYNLQPATLQTCKQLYEEGSRILYKENTIGITVPFNFPLNFGCTFPDFDRLDEVFVLQHRRFSELFKAYPKLKEAVKWIVRIHVGPCALGRERTGLDRVNAAAKGLKDVEDLRQLTVIWIDEGHVPIVSARGGKPLPPPPADQQVYTNMEVMQKVMDCFRDVRAGTTRFKKESEAKDNEDIDMSKLNTPLQKPQARIPNEETAKTTPEKKVVKAQIKKAAKVATGKTDKKSSAKKEKKVAKGTTVKKTDKATTKNNVVKKSKASNADSRIIREKVTRSQKKKQGVEA